MKVVTTFHQPSAVLASVKCRLASDAPDLEHLVVAKFNRLDVSSLQPEGLTHECSLEIWGTIIAVHAIPNDDSHYSTLLVMTDHPNPEIIFLSYETSDQGNPSLVTTKHISLSERSARPAEFFNNVLVDASGSIAVVSCYVGKLKIILLNNGKYNQDFDVSIRELNIRSLALITSEAGVYAVAILHIDHEEHVQLLARDISIEDMELSLTPSTLLPSTILSSKSFPHNDDPPTVIAIAASLDGPDKIPVTQGILIAGGRRILYYEVASQEWQDKQKGKQRRNEAKKKSLEPAEVRKAKEKETQRINKRRKPKASVEWPWSYVTAWCGVDEKRYLLGDAFGRLAMLNIDESGLILIPLGEESRNMTSAATTLTYLTNQTLFVGSRFGNSQILHIHSSPVSSLERLTLPIPSNVPTQSPSSLIPAAKGKEKASSDGKDSQGIVVESKGNFLTVLDSITNISPINDAVLVEIDGSGQREIIACSGGRNTGSINILRTGADFEEAAFVEGIQNIVNVWPIRSTFRDRIDAHLVVSTLHETHLLRLGNDNVISRVSSHHAGLITNKPTLAVANIPRRVVKGRGQPSSYQDSPLIVQVTSKGIYLFEYNVSLGQYVPHGSSWSIEDGNRTSQETRPSWAGREIVAASVNASQFVLAIKGAVLLLLNLTEHDNFQVVKFREVGDLSDPTREIAAVSCTPLDPSKEYSVYIIVSYWVSNYVEILSLSTLESYLMPICKTPSLPSLPCSVLLHNFGHDRNSKGADYHPHLCVGLGDGSVMSFAFRNKQLVDQNIVSLGDSPVSMVSYDVNGEKAIFACGSRASILYWERERLHHSPIILKDVMAAARLNSVSFASSLILSTPMGLSIGRVKDLDKIHIRSVPLGMDTPLRIKHHPALNVFGIGCIRLAPFRVGDLEGWNSSFQLFDGTSFSKIAEFKFEPDEEITAIEAVTLAPDDHTSGDTPHEYFCVGTVWHDPATVQSTDGRLLIFRMYPENGHDRSSTSALSVVAKAEVHGCVFSIVSINGMIAAAVNTSVIIYKLDSKDKQTLHKVAEWNHNYVVIDLVSRGDRLVVGDNISSVSVIRLSGSQLQVIARDYRPLGPICVDFLDDMTIIGANCDRNMFLFTIRQSGTEQFLDRSGSYYMGDIVNKLIPGSMASLADQIDETIQLKAKQLFFTSSGRIGVVMDMADETSLHMSALQRNMANVIHGAGGMDHTEFRAPKNNRGHSGAQAASFGFLDGDYLERFLTCSPSEVEEIIGGRSEAERLTLPHERIVRVLEKLQSLH